MFEEVWKLRTKLVLMGFKTTLLGKTPPQQAKMFSDFCSLSTQQIRYSIKREASD